MRGALWVAGVVCLSACSSFGSSPLVPSADAGSDAAPDGSPPEVAKTALLAHYAFDDGAGGLARDSSGNRHDGDLKIGAEWTQGIYGGAIRFDRAKAGSVTTMIEGFGLASLTVAVWVKSSDTASEQSRLCGAGYPSGSYLFLNFHKGSPLLEARTPHAYWGSGDTIHPSIAEEVWHHVAIILDRSIPEGRTYIDGSKVAHAPPDVTDGGVVDDTFGDLQQTYKFMIGAQGGGVGTEFGGTLDELWVFRRVLEDAEIALLARRP